MLNWFLLVNLYAALFFGLYLLFLKNRSAWQWSRFYLLIASLLALVLPLLKLTVLRRPVLVSSGSLLRERIPELLLHSGAGVVETRHISAPVIVYMVICFLLFLRLLFPFIRLRLLVKQLRNRQNASRLLTRTGIGPGSFGKYILFPGEEVEARILAHEQAHVWNKHYLDKAYFHLLLCFCFPVIAFYAMRKELEIIQEFQADAAAADDRGAYSHLLLHQYFPADGLSLMQSFFKHPIKRRIMMLSKMPRPAKKVLLIFAAALSVSGLLLLQNIYPVYAQQKPLSENVFRSVEQMPEYPGGSQALLNYLSTHISYPESALNESIRGRAFIEFVVGANGKVSAAKILKGITPDCNAELLRVINNMPDWKPGEQDGKKVAVYYTLPVVFSFNQGAEDIQDFK